jgi:hypothetical protein
MPLHRKRRATQAGSKSGPPALSGRPPKRAGCVTEFARALARAASCSCPAHFAERSRCTNVVGFGSNPPAEAQ